MSELRYDLHVEPDTKDVVVILPGIGGGMDQSLVRGVFDAAVSRGLAVATFDYPFFTRKDEKPSHNLIEEGRAFANFTSFLAKEAGFRKAHVIGKSLGGIVVGHVIEAGQSALDIRKLTILGFVQQGVSCEGLASVDLEVIQGSADRNGDAEKVRTFLDANKVNGVRIMEIADATHSFRDAETDSLPVHEAEAIAAINWLNKK